MDGAPPVPTRDGAKLWQSHDYGIARHAGLPAMHASCSA